MEELAQEVIYPDSDGKPMGDNTQHVNWMWKISEGLETQYADDPNVFVACNLLWYPVEGTNRLRVAPDVMVALGRPPGDRGSYRQWEEAGVAPAVAFEIRSPSNRAGELQRKFRFFQRYGVREYYLYDPSRFELQGWQRCGRRLRTIPDMNGWISPLLGIRFDLSAGELRIFDKTGREFVSREQARMQREYLVRIAQTEKSRAEHERLAKEVLAAKLRELGVDPDAVTRGM